MVLTSYDRVSCLLCHHQLLFLNVIMCLFSKSGCKIRKRNFQSKGNFDFFIFLNIPCRADFFLPGSDKGTDNYELAKLELFVSVETETVNGNCQINQIVARDVGIQRLFIEESDFPIALEDHCRIG